MHQGKLLSKNFAIIHHPQYWINTAGQTGTKTRQDRLGCFCDHFYAYAQHY